MAGRTTSRPAIGENLAHRRNALVLEQARAEGLIGQVKDARLAARVPARLLKEAKRRAHVSSDTELLEIALSRLVLEDDFGARLVRRKGVIAAEIDLDL